MGAARANDVSRDRHSVARAAVLVLSVIAGAYVMALAVESPKHWWLGWVTLLPLLLCIRVLSPFRAMLAGGVWGLSLFVFSVGATETQIAPTLGSAVLLSVIPALYAYLGARQTRQVGFSPLLLALGWVGVEFALRPLGLRHGLLAGTQGDGVVIGLLGSFAGYVLVAFLVAYVNASLLSVLTHMHGRIPSSRFVTRTGSPARPFFPLEVPGFLFRLIRPARPRAPPVVA